jgi:hypothetical protein
MISDYHKINKTNKYNRQYWKNITKVYDQFFLDFLSLKMKALRFFKITHLAFDTA